MSLDNDTPGSPAHPEAQLTLGCWYHSLQIPSFQESPVLIGNSDVRKSHLFPLPLVEVLNHFWIILVKLSDYVQIFISYLLIKVCWANFLIC